jgi:hypothetical protein
MVPEMVAVVAYGRKDDPAAGCSARSFSPAVPLRRLSPLCACVGASTLGPGAGPNENPSAQGFSLGAGIWWKVSGIVASLAGGYVAGRLSGKPKPSTTSWRGLIAWALTTLVVFYLLTSAIGGLVGGAWAATS